MKAIRIYLLYFGQFFKSRLAYKADFFASLAATAISGAGGLLFILFLMDGEQINNLKGWSRDEVLFIYAYSMFAMSFFSMLAPNLYNFADRYIIRGEFDRILLRPLNSLCQVLFESFNIESIGNFLVGAGVIAYTAGRLQISFGILDYVWLLVSSLSGAVILLSFFVFLSSLSFHWEDRIGIAPPFYNMIAFGRYPLPIFNRFLQVILSWVVPFGFVAFYPATHFFSRPGFAFFCYFTPVMALLTLVLAVVFWQFGVSRYASTGN
ncbi:MAG: ABC-2 family transporter protein [Bdellovibrionales bacterium]|nr:ABC-2 family transporter protein [Bdellovibrionales bacterium]